MKKHTVELQYKVVSLYNNLHYFHVHHTIEIITDDSKRQERWQVWNEDARHLFAVSTKTTLNTILMELNCCDMHS
jgi:hypothetical protein